MDACGGISDKAIEFASACHDRGSGLAAGRQADVDACGGISDNKAIEFASASDGRENGLTAGRQADTDACRGITNKTVEFGSACHAREIKWGSATCCRFAGDSAPAT